MSGWRWELLPRRDGGAFLNYWGDSGGCVTIDIHPDGSARVEESYFAPDAPEDATRPIPNLAQFLLDWLKEREVEDE